MDKVPTIRPRATLLQRLDAAGRACFPGASTLGLVLLLAAPLGLPGQPELQPAVLLGCVFFWSVFRPALLPPPAVFGLALLSDLLADAPIGVTVLTLLIVHGIAVRWRGALLPRGMLLLWLAFSALAASAVALGWALNSALAVRLLPPGPVAFEAALAIGLYPALAALLLRAHRGIAAPEEA